MKRIFKLGMIAFALSLCFSGCGTKEGRKSSETVSEFKAEDISLGEVVDGVYTSKMLNLKFDGNANDMDVTAEEEFTNRLDGKVVKRSDMDAVHDRLDKGYYIRDMEGIDNKNPGNYVEVMIYKDKNHEMKNGLEKYIDNEVKKQEGEQKERFKNPKVKKTTRDFLGEKLFSVDIIIDEDGIESADATLYKQLGEYFIEIYVRGEKSEDIDKYLGMFEKYKGSDDNEKSSKSDEFGKTDNKSDIEFSKGEIINDVYTNKMFDIQFDAKANGYVFDEVATSIMDPISEEDMISYIKKGGTAVDMVVAKETDNAQKLVVSISENKGQLNKYLDKQLKKDSKAERLTVTISGKDVPCLFTEGRDKDSKYQYTAYIEAGDYIGVVSSNGPDKDSAKAAFDLFTKISESSLTSGEVQTDISGEGIIPGKIIDNVYSNEMMNIKFDANATGLEFVSDEGLKNMGNGGIERSDIAAVNKYIKDGRAFIDMFLTDSTDTTKRISVSLAENNIKIPMDEYLDAQKEIMEKQFSKAPKEQLNSFEIKKGQAGFLGEEIQCLDIDVDTTVAKQSQKYLFIPKDDYMMIVVSSGQDEASAQAALDLFKTIE
nr:hypothetical protein [uncultured Lachnoanaerobaculum sp.]